MWPTTIGGWVAVAVGVTVVTTALLGITVRLARMHIDSRIDKALRDTVHTAVAAGMAPINVTLSALQLQITTQDGELVRIGDRTRSIESKIDNGLCARQERIEGKMDRMLEHYMWDGDERRAQ